MAADLGRDLLGVVRFVELPVVSWRNGGGVTREVLAGGGSGQQDFDWRISIAEVNAPGPFSAFPGVDRVITLVDGAQMDLVIDGVDHSLGLYEPLSFDGGSEVFCSLPAGPTRDLNVMTRRDRLSATVTIRDLSETRPVAVGSSQTLVLLTGSAVVVDADGRCAELHVLDTVCPGGQPVRLVRGSGQVAVIGIESHRETPDT